MVNQTVAVAAIGPLALARAQPPPAPPRRPRRPLAGPPDHLHGPGARRARHRRARARRPFQRRLCRELFTCALDNASLLEAIRALAFFRPERAKSLARVNHRDLGTEELGSVYESLLELHPVVEREPWGFSYVGLNGDGVRGSERKLSGSYYTPDSLVQELIKSALEPVIRRTATDHPYDQRRALLDLRIVDPACGSGHFLLAAARRLAYEIARIDAAPDAPTEARRQHALREVVQRCIYGVDKNPLAVELCRTALWIETVEPGKPLSFLDHRIREGDSLIGVFNLAVLEDGIPDEAYRPKTGDDRAVARDLLQRNRAERKGQTSFAWGAPGTLRANLDRLAEANARLDRLPEDDLDAVAGKREGFERLRTDPERLRLQTACDLWTGAFFAPLRKPAPGHPERIPTTDTVRRALDGDLAQAFEGLVWELGEHRFLHWPLAFPDVFAKGGFDVVLGNPPWEVLQLSEEEFFAARDPRIANASNKAARERLIKALASSDNPVERKLFNDFQRALHASDASGEFVRGSGRWPLTAVGKLNTYALFAELFLRLISDRGRAGMVVPTGIATADQTKAFFGELVSSKRLVSLYSFFEIRQIFPATDDRSAFCLLTVGKTENAIRFAFSLRSTEDLHDDRRRFTLSSEDIALINPNTRTCPIFRTGVDAELTKRIDSSIPVLIDESKGDAGNPWGISFRQGLFNMATDSGLFVTTQELLDGAPLPNEPKKSLISHIHGVAQERGMAPLYEAKMIHHFDHRWASYAPAGDSAELSEADKADHALRVLPRYWLDAREVEARLASKGRTRGWLMGWRDISKRSAPSLPAPFHARPQVTRCC